MSFATMMAAARDSSRITVDAGWGQGRASFGGLVAALLLARLGAQMPADRRLRSMTISFVGPVAPGEAEIETTIFRSGKSVTQAEARLVQNGEVQAALLASFGAHRTSSVHVPAPVQTGMPDPASGQRAPHLPGLTPEFLQHYEIVWTAGQPPFSGCDAPDFSGYARYADHAETFTLEHLVALVDAWPPSVLPMLKQISPASSLCWTMELLTEDIDPNPAAWWYYDVKTDQATEGYEHSQATVRDQAGRLVAVSRQTVTVFG